MVKSVFEYKREFEFSGFCGLCEKAIEWNEEYRKDHERFDEESGEFFMICKECAEKGE